MCIKFLPANPWKWGNVVFVPNWRVVARDSMMQIDGDLVEKYQTVIEFLTLNPDSANTQVPTGILVGSAEYIKLKAQKFATGRTPRAPQPPRTIPDPLVSVILRDYFGVSEEHLERASHEHLLSMGAEGLVGSLLEEYLASVLEPVGWVFCSGSIIKAVDFIKRPTVTGGNWAVLQVKNRDNSENSSSSAIRNGTDIEKWFRTFSRTGETNWAAFPDEDLTEAISEEQFEEFVQSYLISLPDRPAPQD
jgi:hypothetical protein